MLKHTSRAIELRQINRCRTSLMAVLLLPWLANASFAEDDSADKVARELANPNNSLASLTFKNQYRTYTGDLPGADDQSNYTLLFQPVFPFAMEAPASGGKANLFVRPGIPLLVDQPVFEPGKNDYNSVTAIGDIGFDVGYGVTEPTGFLWALGMVGTLPTATDDDIGGHQVRLGPEVLLAKFAKWGVYGALPSHQWDVSRSGKEGDYQFSTTQLQLFFNLLPGGGWTVGTAPQLSYDWISEEATIPLNITVGKTIMAGKMPLKLQVEANYYVKQPDLFGPDWMLAVNITPVVHNFIEEWIRGD